MGQIGHVKWGTRQDGHSHIRPHEATNPMVDARANSGFRGVAFPGKMGYEIFDK